MDAATNNTFIQCILNENEQGEGADGLTHDDVITSVKYTVADNANMFDLWNRSNPNLLTKIRTIPPPQWLTGVKDGGLNINCVMIPGMLTSFVPIELLLEPQEELEEVTPPDGPVYVDENTERPEKLELAS